MSDWFVVGMGVGTVFTGLVCIIVFCMIMSGICRLFAKKPKETQVAPVQHSAPEIQNRQELIAAVSAALAEELGTDISAIRIHSFKKV
ncbi:MAG: OadG family protein [Clostridia bacterium]|nr:OadG family protein [Clostridia bacterium]